MHCRAAKQEYFQWHCLHSFRKTLVFAELSRSRMVLVANFEQTWAKQGVWTHGLMYSKTIDKIKFHSVTLTAESLALPDSGELITWKSFVSMFRHATTSSRKQSIIFSSLFPKISRLERSRRTSAYESSSPFGTWKECSGSSASGVEKSIISMRPLM